MHIFQLLLPDGKDPCQSLPQLSRNYHLQTKHFFKLFHPADVYM